MAVLYIGMGYEIMMSRCKVVYIYALHSGMERIISCLVEPILVLTDFWESLIYVCVLILFVCHDSIVL